jgi:hypothetical protein
LLPLRCTISHAAWQWGYDKAGHECRQCRVECSGRGGIESLKRGDVEQRGAGVVLLLLFFHRCCFLLLPVHLLLSCLRLLILVGFIQIILLVRLVRAELWQAAACMVPVADQTRTVLHAGA